MILAELFYKVIEEGEENLFLVNDIIDLFAGKIDDVVEKLCWLEKFGAIVLSDTIKEVSITNSSLHIGQNPEEKVMKPNDTIYKTWKKIRTDFLCDNVSIVSN